MTIPCSGSERLALLSRAQVMLIFTPHLIDQRAPLEVLASVLDYVDIIQVRAKSKDEESTAREQHDWTVKVLELVREHDAEETLVLVNDRVDVARALQSQGCAGAHIGQDDCPPEIARELLGPEALLGLSTHDMKQVAQADTEFVNYLGFGPIWPTATKGYESGVGAEHCWVAANSTSIPVFPIGGIDAHNASELTNVGRVAVSSAILAAEDPARAADALRAALEI